MKTFLLLVLILPMVVYSQNEKFTYCVPYPISEWGPVGGEPYPIVMTSVQQIGDTVIKQFGSSWGEDMTGTFSYIFIHDTIYAEIQGERYFIGTSTTQVGDTWQTPWIISGTLYQQDENCPAFRTLMVSEIDTLPILGMDRKIIRLKLMDETPFSSANYPATYTFLEGIGVTDGGPLYNLNWRGNCTNIEPSSTDDITFTSYEIGNAEYLPGEPCVHLDPWPPDTVGTSEATERMENVTYVVKDGMLMFQSIPMDTKIRLIDVSGRHVGDGSAIRPMDVRDKKGLYFIYLTNGKTNYSMKIVLE